MNNIKKNLYLLLAILVIGTWVNAQDQPGKTVESIKASLQKETLVLEWVVSPEMQFKTADWQVQGSTDGKHYKTIGFVWGMEENQLTVQYKQQLKGDQKRMRFYRVVRMEGVDKGIASNSVSL